MSLALNRRLGIIALVCAAFLAFIAIPYWVSSPSNIRNIVLAPTFWPYALSGMLALIGLGLLGSPAVIPPAPEQKSDESVSPDTEQSATPWLRLLGMAVIMVLTMFALPTLGMVWTSMLVFLLCAFMFQTRYPITAIICAVIIPLVLYAFFAHVAGVAIPQGEFVRLP